MRLQRRRNLISRADNKVLLVAVLFVCSALLSALAQADVQTVDGLEFSRVQLIGSNQLEFTQGADTKLKIRGDEGDLTPHPFVLQGETLRLGVSLEGGKVSGVKYRLTAPGLEALLVEGSGEAYVKPLAVADLLLSLEGSGTLRLYDVQALNLEMRVVGSGELQAVDVSAEDVRLNLKGSGALQLGSLHADVVRAHMAGSGDISVEDGGEANFVEVRVMGSGDVALREVTARAADVNIMGSGDVHLGVEETLDVKIMGSGDMNYYGSPNTSTSVMGSGDIEQND